MQKWKTEGLKLEKEKIDLERKKERGAGEKAAPGYDANFSQSKQATATCCVCCCTACMASQNRR